MNNEKFVPTLGDYLESFLRPSTALSYYKRITRFLEANPGAALYDYSGIMKYIEQLRKQCTSSTILTLVALLKIYYDYLIQIGERKDNPIGAIRLRDYQNHPIQLQDLFSRKELENLLELGKDQNSFLSKRNQILISLLIYQALRREEIANLKTGDIDLEKAQIHIRQSVQTNARTLPLQARQAFLFYTYLEDRSRVLNSCKKPASEMDFFIIKTTGEAFKKESMVDVLRFYRNKTNKNLTAGTIRQSVIANLLSKGTDLRIVQEFAGHKYLGSTEKYRETGLKALQTAIEKHHPLK